MHFEQDYGAGDKVLPEQTAQVVTLPWMQRCCHTGPDGSSDPTLLLTCLGLLPRAISLWPVAGNSGVDSRFWYSQLSLSLWLCRLSVTGSEALVWGPADACEKGAGPLSPNTVIGT